MIAQKGIRDLWTVLHGVAIHANTQPMGPTKGTLQPCGKPSFSPLDKPYSSHGATAPLTHSLGHTEVSEVITEVIVLRQI